MRKDACGFATLYPAYQHVRGTDRARLRRRVLAYLERNALDCGESADQCGVVGPPTMRSSTRIGVHDESDPDYGAVLLAAAHDLQLHSDAAASARIAADEYVVPPNLLGDAGSAAHGAFVLSAWQRIVDDVRSRARDGRAAELTRTLQRAIDADRLAGANECYGAACEFLRHFHTLAYHARRYRHRPDRPDTWRDVGGTFACAFLTWFDLSRLLTPAVRTQALGVYSLGSPPIKLGKTKATPTVIEAVADELGVYFRNTVYAGRRHPLEADRERVADDAKARALARQVGPGKPAEPFGWGADFDELMKEETCAAVRARLGIKTPDDGLLLMVKEWDNQGRERAESALTLLRCESIDFDDLQTQLKREAEAVIAAASKPNAPTIDPAMLARLEAAVAGLPAVLEEVRAGLAREPNTFGSPDQGNPPSIGGTDTDWKDVQGRLLAKRERGEPYTSLGKLCAELGCSDATIRKAIKRSVLLGGWQARGAKPKAAPKATTLDAVVRDNTRQATEPAPDDFLRDDDVDATMARLIDQATPDVRAKLNAMDDAKRRALVAAYQSHYLDDEPSPLEPDKPGERPRKVKQHKRA